MIILPNFKSTRKFVQFSFQHATPGVNIIQCATKLKAQKTAAGDHIQVDHIRLYDSIQFRITYMGNEPTTK